MEKSNPQKIAGLWNRRQTLGLMSVAAGVVASGSLIRPAFASTSIRYQNLWNTSTDTHYEGMQYLYKAFAEAYPDVDIQDIQIPTGELAKKNMADCAAGDCPEIMHDLNNAGDQWSPGYLLDLTPYLDADPAWKGTFFEKALNFGSTDGHIWGLPAEVTPLPCMWNSRILDKAGVSDFPRTIDDMMAAGEKLKAAGHPLFSMTRDSVQVLHNLVAGQDGGLDAIQKNQFDSPQFVKAFETMKMFIDNGLTPDNDIELNTQQANALFVSERTGMMINGIWSIRNNLRSKSAAPDLADVIDYSAYPAIGSLGTVLENKVATMVGLASALKDKPNQLEAALSFFKFWFTPEMAKNWVVRTWSPIGIQIDLDSVEGFDPAPKAFLDSYNDADFIYSLPPTRAMQERHWSDAKAAAQALMAGQSAEQALGVYLGEMSKYR